MAMFSDKQLIAVVAVGLVGAWYVYRKASQAISDTIETAGEVGEAVGFLGEYYLDEAIDAVSSTLTLDEFDSKYRHQTKLMNDEQYQRWKTAVQAGQIENHFKE